MLACCVDTIGEENDSLTSANAIEFLVYHHVDRVVKLGAVTWPCLANRVLQAVALAGEVSQNPYLVVKGNYHHAVVRVQLVDKSNCGILDLFQFETRRAACVDHQDHAEGFID